MVVLCLALLSSTVHSQWPPPADPPQPPPRCPIAPSGYEYFPNSCIGTDGHNCGKTLSMTVNCSGGLEACITSAAETCSADSKCRSFALQVSDSSSGCAGPHRMLKWQTFALGSQSAVNNSQWIAYARPPSGPTPPRPPPGPGPSPTPSGRLGPEIACPFRISAWQHANLLHPHRSPNIEIFDALRLETECNETRPKAEDPNYNAALGKLPVPLSF